MKPLEEALKEPVEETFRRFAFLDLEAVEEGEWPERDVLAVEVVFEEASRLLLVMERALTREMAANLNGGRAGPAEMEDVAREFANVLSGVAYEVVMAGRKPPRIGIPRVLEGGARPERESSDGLSLLLRDEGGVRAGIAVRIPQEWTSFRS